MLEAALWGLITSGSLLVGAWLSFDRRAMLPHPFSADRPMTKPLVLAPLFLAVSLALAPSFLGFGGPFYMLSAIVLGAVFLALSLNVYRIREGRAADRAAKQLFGFSILYLFGLFAALLAERSLALWSA